MSTHKNKASILNKSIPALLDLYVRIMVLVLALTVGIVILFAGARDALAANLRDIAIISGDMLTVGDIFDGLKPDKANYVLGPAPQPGKDMVLNTQTLMKIAMALDLTWRPYSSTEQIIVRRAATVIDESTIKKTLKKALTDKGAAGRIELVWHGSAPSIVMPQGKPETFEIASLNFDPQKDFFEARLAAPSVENPVTETIVTGEIRRLVAVPVLKDTLREGDIIGATDIDYVDVYSSELQHDLILKEENLIGMTPRRMVTAGKPVRDNELERPQIVDRGDFVTIIYQSGPLTLTTKGKALQNGARGDMVRVVNIASSKSLDGFVSAEREVTIVQ